MKTQIRADDTKRSVKPTIVDVARLAGVSFKTVSRVINDEKYVGEDLRKKVQAAIETLGFVPNIGARTIRGGRHMIIALLFPDRKSQYQLEIQDAALSACRAAGYHMIAEPLPAHVLADRELIRKQMAGVKVDGYIILPPLGDNADLLAVLQESGKPFSRLAPAEHAQVGAEVVVDDGEAVRSMVDHLWALGHRRIGFVIGTASHSSARSRLTAFVDHVTRLSGTVPLDLILQGDFTAETGRQAAEKLLDLPEPPTAIFASNDEMATGVISHALGRGIRIPDDLSVCGFDDSPIARLIWPALTTVHQPLADMVQVAVQQLIKPRSPQRVTLPLTLVQRQSTGPVPVSRG